MKKIVLIVGIVLLSGIGALSYFQGWLPFSVSDQDILSTMIENMAKNKTLHTDMNMIVSAESPDQGEVSIVLDIESDTDRTDIENPKSAIKFDGTLNMEGMSFSLGLEMKTLNQEDIYFRITTIPILALPFLEILGIDFDELKNQWIKIDQEYLGDIVAENNEEMIEQLAELITGKEFLIVKERFADQKINNIDCYHYLVLLDKDELIKVLPELMDIIMENNPPFDCLSESERKQVLEDAVDGINEFFNKVGDMSSDVWIGKKDKLLYRLEIEKEMDISEFDIGQEGTINIKLKFDFSKFNEKINIQAPEEFKSLDEIFPAEMFSGQVLGEWI